MCLPMSPFNPLLISQNLRRNMEMTIEGLWDANGQVSTCQSQFVAGTASQETDTFRI